MGVDKKGAVREMARETRRWRRWMGVNEYMRAFWGVVAVGDWREDWDGGIGVWEVNVLDIGARGLLERSLGYEVWGWEMYCKPEKLLDPDMVSCD